MRLLPPHVNSGLMLGSSKPHNVLVIGRCPAWRAPSRPAIADAHAPRGFENRTRANPYRQYAAGDYRKHLRPSIQLRTASFVEAFSANDRQLSAGRAQSGPWISLEQLIQGLNEELRDTAPGQRVECSHWFKRRDRSLSPNPNVGRRAPTAGLFDDEEFAGALRSLPHVAYPRSETGSFFTGPAPSSWRRRASGLNLPESKPTAESSPMFVITGSPGTGKSAPAQPALLSFSQPDLSAGGAPIWQSFHLKPYPGPMALEGVIWWPMARPRRQVISELARVPAWECVDARRSGSVWRRPHGQGKVICGRCARRSGCGRGLRRGRAREVLAAPLVSKSSVRLMIATRKHAIGGAGTDLPP